jgi:glyoxylase-like metal-dependent hydrolase (beta-lactamase superfamily II)
MTLSGTNTYIYGFSPCFVIDPGPEDADHVAAILKAGEERGGIGAFLATHSHEDHIGAAALLDSEITVLGDGVEIGALRVLATPGHAADHVVFLTPDGVCFCGDLVLGLGSTIVPPGGNSLVAFLDSLALLESQDLTLMAPGHGPWITDPAAKLAEYVEHRMMRERRLIAALDSGERSRAALLAAVWDDVPPELLPMAAMAMEAHLEKLEAEARLPADLVE